MLTPAAVAAPSAIIVRANPLAKLAAASLIAGLALSSTDWALGLTLLVIEAALLPLTGVRVGRFLWRIRYLAFAAFTVGVVNTVFATGGGGTVWFDAGPLHVTSSDVDNGLALALRVGAMAIPGVLALATTDPTDLADALIQQLRVSPRFAIGALAAFRMLPLLAGEWRLIAMARRARGVDAGWNPVRRLRLFASTMFALLVGAIRRGTRLATAMDARGFDSGVPRTHARIRRMRGGDWVLLAATAVACLAVYVAVVVSR